MAPTTSASIRCPTREIVNPRDAIVEVTSTAICGSDLHLYDGVIPGVWAGDILGHEFMGRVVETGPKSTLQNGQRVVVPVHYLLRRLLSLPAEANSPPARTRTRSRTRT